MIEFNIQLSEWIVYIVLALMILPIVGVVVMMIVQNFRDKSLTRHVNDELKRIREEEKKNKES